MNNSPQSVLRGQCILNTRPAHQQAELNRLMTAQGASVLAFPTIEISRATATGFHQNLASHLNDYQIAIFVSRNAVDGAFAFLGSKPLPAHLKLAVIGEGTYQALAQRVEGLDRRLIRSEPYNSEGLLDAGELQQVDGQNILIFRGQQGRTLLTEQLQARGASVDHCEVYRRNLPDYDDHEFARLSEKQAPTLVLLTSTEGMHNLLALVDEAWRSQLLHTPWLLISERMRESAIKLGHNAGVIIARKASDAGIHQSICEWAERT
ncbi:MAG: uroporphyrinogen-III synthase [Gammaproteobacteria bacterium]|nr:uroporphyrinogen-III synthase [Gammaproteobacteria bacterium]